MKLAEAMERERVRRRKLEEAHKAEMARRAMVNAARAAEVEKRMAAAREEAEAICTCTADGMYSCAERELVELPMCVAVGYGAVMTKLDLSWNGLVSLASVKPLIYLEELVVDNCELASPIQLPELAFLRVLSLNNNKLIDIHDILTRLRKCPRIAMLSLLKNPLCPDALLSAATEAEYGFFRQYLIAAIPTLEFLDAAAVSTGCRRGAVARFEDASAGVVVPIQEVIATTQEWVHSKAAITRTNVNGLVKRRGSQVGLAVGGSPSQGLRRDCSVLPMDSPHNSPPRQTEHNNAVFRVPPRKSPAEPNAVFELPPQMLEPSNEDTVATPRRRIRTAVAV